MKVMALLNPGRAAPYAIYDLGEGFQACGHEVMYTKVTEIHDLIQQMDPSEFLVNFGERVLRLGVDFVVGYGGMPFVFPTERQDRAGINTIWDLLQIPYASIWFDSPTAEQIMPFVIDLIPSKYHYMFIWDRYYLDDLKTLGFRNIHYLPIGTNTKRFKRVQPVVPEDEQRYGGDVVFVGSYSGRRELAMRKLLDFKPIIFGHDWDKARSEDVRKCWRGSANNADELNNVYNYAKVNINVTMEQGITSLNMRVFDVLAAGGFLISDYRKDFETLFDMEEEIVCWKDIDELPGLVEYYLNRPEERKKKAWAGRRRVLREHDYSKRAAAIVETLREGGCFN